MILVIKDTGLRTSNKEKVKKYTMMGVYLKAISIKE